MKRICGLRPQYNALDIDSHPFSVDKNQWAGFVRKWKLKITKKIPIKTYVSFIIGEQSHDKHTHTQIYHSQMALFTIHLFFKFRTYTEITVRIC